MNFAEKLDLLFPEDTVSIYYADEGKRRRERFIPGPRGRGLLRGGVYAVSASMPASDADFQSLRFGRVF